MAVSRRERPGPTGSKEGGQRWSQGVGKRIREQALLGREGAKGRKPRGTATPEAEPAAGGHGEPGKGVAVQGAPQGIPSVNLSSALCFLYIRRHLGQAGL